MKLVSYISCLYYNNISYVIAVITVAPSSVSTTLYTLANFSCEGTGVTLTWTVQGSSLTDPSNQYREISVTTNNISVDVWSSVLTIRALPINDGIGVGCIILGQTPNFVSKGATLTVNGSYEHTNQKLIHSLTGITPVQNIKVTFNITSNSGWLTWFHPLFSSENTPLSYHIYIENQHGQLLYNDIINDTSYESYNLTICDIYTATVIAHSGKYSSSNITIKYEYSGGIFLINTIRIQPFI